MIEGEKRVMRSHKMRGSGDENGVIMRSTIHVNCQTAREITTMSRFRESVNPVSLFGRNEPPSRFPDNLCSEGYDECFDPPLKKEHECPICLLGLREPVQAPCGQRFCRGCIRRSLR